MAVSAEDLRRSAAAAILGIVTVAGRQWRPLPHQQPPPGDWRGWMLRAGRGAGKTDACAHYMKEHVQGPPCLSGPVPHWMSIIAPTQGDGVTACVNGPSGILRHDPTAKLVSGAGGLAVRWENGSEAKIFGTNSREDIERLRAGGNRCLAWCEEMAAWRHLQDGYDQMTFGLRTGPKPRWIASTTPKPRALIKRMVNGEMREVVVTRATTYDNPHLPQEVRDLFLERYEGTDLGAQELMAELIDEAANALWKRAVLRGLHIPFESVPKLHRISVGVDPSGGAGEQGIVVVGQERREVRLDAVPTDPAAATLARLQAGQRRLERHGYVLADMSCSLDPAGWGRRAVEAAVDYDADDIVVETNYGGDMAVATIRGAADHMGISIPVVKVVATRGKKVRAEPVAALAVRRRWWMAGEFEELEDQMCTWTVDADYSPDRMDAMVWPPWHHSTVSVTTTNTVGRFGGSAMANVKIG